MERKPIAETELSR